MYGYYLYSRMNKIYEKKYKKSKGPKTKWEET